MVTIILAACIPLAFIAGGFVAFKGVQLGLRWQMETRKEHPPTMEIKNPVTPIMEAKQEKEQTTVFNEWIHGTDESR